MQQYNRFEHAFEKQSKDQFLKSKHKERQEILAHSLGNQMQKAQSRYSKEEIVTERVCQQMINEFPMVNLKQINRTLTQEALRDNSNLGENFDKSALMLTSSVLGLRQLKKLEPVSGNFCKLSKSLIQRSNQLYKDYDISQFKVQFYNQNQLYYDYLNQDKLNRLKTRDFENIIS